MTLRLLLLPVLALSLAACGSSDPKQDYVNKANKVCDKAEDDFADLQQPTSVAGFAPFAEQTLEIAKKAERDIAALSPPEQDRAELDAKVLNPFAALISEGEVFVEKVKAAGQDQAQLVALLSQRPDANSIDMAFLRSYGLGTCADAISLGL